MKFRTVIKHVPGSHIEVAGDKIELVLIEDAKRGPKDADYATLETENPVVIARLLEIPEGFAPVVEAHAAVAVEAPVKRAPKA